MATFIGGVSWGRYSFRSANGHYLVAEGGGGGVCNANRGAVGAWEQWAVWCDGWKWYMQAHNAAGMATSGNYLCLQDDGAVVANRLERGAWETLQILKYHDTEPSHSGQSNLTLTQNAGFPGWKVALAGPSADTIDKTIGGVPLKSGDRVFIARFDSRIAADQIGGPNHPVQGGILMADGGGGGGVRCSSGNFGGWELWTVTEY